MIKKHEKHNNTKWLNGKHWMSPTYTTWISMRQRCNNSKHMAYPKYGAVGIRVCKSWDNSFINFLKDMGERPVGKSIDRKDNTMGYFPENCRWATPKQQANNTRANISNYRKGLLKKFNIDNRTYLYRKKTGWKMKDFLIGNNKPEIGESSYNEIKFKLFKKYLMSKFKQSATVLKAYISILDPREKDIIERRLGFKDGKRETLEDIGKRYKLSRERIRQIEEKALRKISVLETQLISAKTD